MRSPVRRPCDPGHLARAAARRDGRAPAAFAAKPPPNTKVAGIDVDRTTIPQLQALMNRHRLTSVQLTQFYLHRIKKLNPKLHAVITVSPTALADAARGRQGAPRTATAGRCSGSRSS